LKIHDLLRRDIAVTLDTFDLGCRMRTVAEEDKAGQFMDQLQRDLSLGEVHVTGLTLRQNREARPIRLLRIHVAEGAFLLQGRVLLVIERPVLTP